MNFRDEEEIRQRGIRFNKILNASSSEIFLLKDECSLLKVGL